MNWLSLPKYDHLYRGRNHVNFVCAYGICDSPMLNKLQWGCRLLYIRITYNWWYMTIVWQHIQGFRVKEGLGCMLFSAVAVRRTRNLALPWLNSNYLCALYMLMYNSPVSLVVAYSEVASSVTTCNARLCDGDFPEGGWVILLPCNLFDQTCTMKEYVLFAVQCPLECLLQRFQWFLHSQLRSS